MVSNILSRIFRRHLALHLVVPLIVGFLFNAAWIHFQQHHSWHKFISDLVSSDNLVFGIGVAVTYLVIMYYQIKQETSVTIRGNELAVLDEELNTAVKYFATGAIGLREWFDPVSQVFLSSITRRKLQNPAFQDERVLLFVSKSQMGALDLPVLEGYYAERLVDIHINHNTPLGYLKPEEVRHLLTQLNRETWKVIRAYPRWLKRLPDWLLDRIPWIVGRGIRRLDFAFIIHENGSKSVLLVGKEGENLKISPVDKSKISAYEEFVELIKKRIYKPNLAEIDASHDFIKYYHPSSPWRRASSDAVSQDRSRKALSKWVKWHLS